ncbi:MAG: hypothetical protein IJE68_01435 [Clostridia bacterium]|nr:hypothetical protein [Clostridia bacterium]
MEEIIMLGMILVFILIIIIIWIKEDKNYHKEMEKRDSEFDQHKLWLEKQKKRHDRMVLEGYAYYEDDIYNYNDIELNDEYDKEIKEYKFIIQKNLPRFESSKKIKVLVGDYDLMSISNTITVLKSMGITTKAARSGREIIKRIMTGEKYDLIITNNVYTKGNCDGPETLDELRKIEGFNTPVVVLTVSSGKRHLFMGEYGFDEYMCKLLTQEQVIETLPKVIKDLKFTKVEEQKKESNKS